MKGNNKDSSWLLNFERPEPHILSQIREIACKLKALPFDKKKCLPRSEAALEGTIDQILPLLQERLDRDYSENLSEAETAPYLFDYVVMEEAGDESLLRILTRLYHPTEGGNIFYGRTIKRLSNDEYIVWIDG